MFLFLSPDCEAVFCVFWRSKIILGGSGGLLTPFTFAQHHLVPWLLLLMVHTFCTVEGSDSEFANFTLPTLKAFLEAGSQTVSGNKQ